MAEIGYKCPFCNKLLTSESYGNPFAYIAYCDNKECGKFCTDATLPSRVSEELKELDKGEVR